MERSAKTHLGVRSEFAGLTRDGAPSDRDSWRALADGYRYEEMADQSTDPDADVSDEATGSLIADAARFVDRIAALLSAPPPAAG